MLVFQDGYDGIHLWKQVFLSRCILARSVLSFQFFPFPAGIGEAGNWPGATKVTQSGSCQERAIAQGILVPVHLQDQ